MIYLIDRVNRLPGVVVGIRNVLLQLFGGKFGRSSLVGETASSKTVFENKKLVLLPGHSLCFKLVVEGVSEFSTSCSDHHASLLLPILLPVMKSYLWNYRLK